MTISPFSLHVPREGYHWGLCDLDEYWNATDNIGPFDYCDDAIMSRSNYATIMDRLRDTDKQGEGNPKGHPDYGFEPDDATWFENGGIYYRAPVVMTPDHWKAARQRGRFVDLDYERLEYVGGKMEDDEHFYQVERDAYECPILDALLEINGDLRDYPVLDEDDYYRREYEGALDSIKSCGYAYALSDEQATTIWVFIARDGMPVTTDDGREVECDKEHLVEFYGDDYSGDLDAAVEYAVGVLGFDNEEETA